MLYAIHSTKAANSADVNRGPLSETICSGRPKAKNNCRKPTMVFVVGVEDISGYFECVSTTIKKICPIKGSAKSKWMRAHGFDGHNQGWRGVTAGSFSTFWQGVQSWTSCSSSLSILGHQT